MPSVVLTSHLAATLAGFAIMRCIPGYYQGVESAIRMVRDVRAHHESTPGARQQTP